MWQHCSRHVRNSYLVDHYSLLPCGFFSISVVGAVTICLMKIDDPAEVIRNHIRQQLFAMRESPSLVEMRN